MREIENKLPLESNLKFILGSASPRRSDLLKSVVPVFSQIAIDADESFSDNIPLHHVAEYLSVKKAKAFRKLGNKELLITADTTVVTENAILNKPKNADDAKRMLQKLSNSSHDVITGVTIRLKNSIYSFNESSKVYFNALTNSEIDFYIKNFQPFDKAGSYGIQEWIGKIGIPRIEGCYYNIMGLPTSKLYEKLKEIQAI